MLSKKEFLDTELSNLFLDLGCWFAFSEKQMTEKLELGNLSKESTYCHLFGGLFCPENHVDEFVARYKDIISKSIQLDLEQNKPFEIIQRELSNHEYSYTGDLDPTIEALNGYGFTDEQISEVAHGRNPFINL